MARSSADQVRFPSPRTDSLRLRVAGRRSMALPIAAGAAAVVPVLVELGRLL